MRSGGVRVPRGRARQWMDRVALVGSSPGLQPEDVDFLRAVHPIVEFLGWLIIPLSIALGYVSLSIAIPLALLALMLGAINSVLSLFLDDRFGYYNEAGQTVRLLFYSLAEHIGMRQRSVVWRVRAMFWNPRKKVWGDMQRTGVGNLAASDSAPIETDSSRAPVAGS